MIRYLVLVGFLLLTACSGGWEARQSLGQTTEGARYGTGWLFGGPYIYVYPSGTVHRRYEGGTTSMRLGQERTYIDRALWLRVAKIVQEKGGEEPLDLTTDENAICDGGYEYLYVRVGEKTAYYHFDAMPCEERIEKHDAAGREIVNIFRELAESFDQKSRN